MRTTFTWDPSMRTTFTYDPGTSKLAPCSPGYPVNMVYDSTKPFNTPQQEADEPTVVESKLPKS